MPAVKIECVAGLKGLHQFGEVGLGSLQEKMEVVGEKTIAEKLYFLLLTVERELFQVGSSVLVVFEDALTVVAATDDVVDGTGVFNANRAGHVKRLSRSIHVFKPDPKIILFLPFCQHPKPKKQIIKAWH